VKIIRLLIEGLVNCAKSSIRTGPTLKSNYFFSVCVLLWNYLGPACSWKSPLFVCCKCACGWKGT